MKIWEIAVDNKVAVYLLMVLIVIFGYTSYTGLPREATPDITIPLVIVSTPYIGVSPIDIEGLISQPLERGLKGLKDIKQISSVSKEGLSKRMKSASVSANNQNALSSQVCVHTGI